MKKKQPAKAVSSGRKKPATPPRRTRPAGADPAKSRRRADPAAAPKLTPRLKKVLAMFPQPELARICGVTRQGVQQWRDLPAKHALAIEAASKGKFSREFLAPSFYPRTAS